MRILYLTQRLPYPPSRGDKILAYHQIRHLARAHEVFVACLADEAEDLEYVATLSKEVHAIDAVPLSRARARLRAAGAVLRGEPLTCAHFWEQSLRDRINRRLATGGIDAVIVSSSGMAQYVESASHLPRIMQFVDLDSQKWRLYAERAPAPWKWVYGLESRRLLRYERHLAQTFDHSVVVTRDEAEDVRRLIPGARVSTIPLGVDVDYFTPEPHVPKVARSVVFVGRMDYWPNEHGAVWFCDHVLPLIEQECPGTSVTLCGAAPAPRVRALADRPGVRVTGTVSDVRPYLAEAQVAIAPLQIARGMQSKVLEALSAGLPTVVTASAFAGLEATENAHLLVGDHPQSFAAQVVRCFTDDDLRARLAASARRFAVEQCRWSVRLSQLDDLLDEVMTRRRSHQHQPQQPCPQPC